MTTRDERMLARLAPIGASVWESTMATCGRELGSICLPRSSGVMLRVDLGLLTMRNVCVRTEVVQSGTVLLGERVLLAQTRGVCVGPPQ